MLVLSNTEIEQLFDMGECISILEEMYVDFAHGEALNSFRSENLSSCGVQDSHFLFKQMGGTWPAKRVHALRINSDIIQYPTIGATVRRVKVPAAHGRWVGLVHLYSTETGQLLAIFPDGVMQRMRVGATTAIAARHLARDDAARVGLIGAGWQAGAQLLAIHAVRPLQSVRVFSPRTASRAAFAQHMRDKLDIEVEAVDSASDCVKGADIILAATSSLVPVIDPAWLTDGTHVSCIRTEELSADVLARCDRVIVHIRDDQQLESLIAPGTPAADYHQRNFAAQRGELPDSEIPWSTFPELTDLVAERVAARTRQGEITCFINNVGLGLQFAAAGWWIFEKARLSGIGRELPDDWFSQDVHS